MTNKKNYLIIPSVPTPNGRLHLGHIAGPYLSADILARYLRIHGHTSLIISGTDSYESYVTAQAIKENLTAEQVCHHYHSLIEQDLLAMDIFMDAFINPLDERWAASYQKWHEKIFEQLVNGGMTEDVKENLLWDKEAERYLTGCWFHGTCPTCEENVTGYFCEVCGDHFRPEEARVMGNDIQEIVSNVFLRISKEISIEGIGINNNIANVFHKFLKKQRHLFRLTTHSDWGLTYKNNSVLFNYGLMFAYFLMLGEVAGKIFKTNQNAFSLNSSVITICSFGIDNAVPFLSSSLGVSAACKKYKPFDHYLVNYFLYLEDSKFSTSRNHAIWVNEVINNKHYSSDIVRLYLSSIDISNCTGNFVAIDFISFYNKTVSWIEEFILHPIQRLVEREVYACDEHLKNTITSNIIFQEKEVVLNKFSPFKRYSVLNKWLEFGTKIDKYSENYFWWLKMASLFLYPIMPKLGELLWQALGYKNFPLLQDFFTQPSMPLQKYISINIRPIA